LGWESIENTHPQGEKGEKIYSSEELLSMETGAGDFGRLLEDQSSIQIENNE